MPPLINLAGMKFGKLTVLGREGGRKVPLWKCRCDCGDKIVVIPGVSLRTGHTKSCGCLGGKFVDLTGHTFGLLTVVKRLPNVKGATMWQCRCSCENETITSVCAGSLRKGVTRSCGCVSREATSRAHLIDLKGQVFGRLTVIKRVGNRHGRVAWLCECTCGNDIITTAKRLRNKSTQSCGCYHKERLATACLRDLTGRRFGRLLVIGRAESAYDTMWRCKCECGGLKDIASSSLIAGLTRSCGCLNKELAHKRRGPNHPSWRSDLTEDERGRKRYGQDNKAWRRAVYERDEYTCQLCKKFGGKLEAHHLDAYARFREKRFLVANGVTLCVKCHDAFHSQYGPRGRNTAAQFDAFAAAYRSGMAGRGHKKAGRKR